VTISTGGGEKPLWASDGTELFFRRVSDGAIMAVPVHTEPTFIPGTAQVVVEGGYVPNALTFIPYDYDAERQRFLMLKLDDTFTGTSNPPQIVTVLNWLEELKERVPVD